MRKKASNVSFEGQQLAGIVATRMALSDPVKTADWLASLPNPDARQVGEVPLAVTWAMKDPQNASQWAGTLPAAERTSVIPTIAAVWARSDSQAALQWINSMTGDMRDASIAGYSAGVGSIDPASATQWALSISDSAMRDQVSQKAAKSWLMQDPETAANWIKSTALSSADKARLLGIGGR